MKYLDAQAHRRKQEAERQRKIAGRKAGTGPPENKALAGPPENKEAETVVVPTVVFASERAAEVAAELGVGADAFDFEPTGATGYTVADVRRAAEA